ECGALIGRLAQMAHSEGCIDIREQRRNVEGELSRDVHSRRCNGVERRIVPIEQLVIETLAHNFSRSLLDLADDTQHSIALVDGPGKNKIGGVVATRAVARVRFRAENREIFSVTPTADV